MRSQTIAGIISNMNDTTDPTRDSARLSRMGRQSTYLLLSQKKEGAVRQTVGDLQRTKVELGKDSTLCEYQIQLHLMDGSQHSVGFSKDTRCGEILRVVSQEIQLVSHYDFKYGE